MQDEKLVLKPKILSGSINRIIESLKHDDRDVDISDPGTADNEGNRTLPHFLLSVAISSIIVGAPALLAYFNFIDIGIDISGSPYLLVPFAMIIPLVMVPIQVFFLVRELTHTRYTVKSDRVEIIDNYLDKGKDTASFDNITDVEMEKPFTQRIFGTGNVLLNTAGSDNKEIRIEFVENPETLQEELSKLISNTEYSQPK